MISKLLRIYKRTYGLRQICNVAIYIVHSACTIHLLNLPDKGAKRDIISGLKNLEEMSESWPCARRTLRILDISAQKWRVDLPAEASTILERCHVKFGSWGSWDQGQSPSTSDESVKMASFEAASVTSTRGSTPEDTPASVRPIASPLEISVPNVTTNSQLAPPFYPGGQSSTTGPAKTVGREYYAPSLPPTLPVAPSQDLDMDIQPKSETDDSQGIIPIPEITSVSVDPPQVPAFTGMENLVEESQDWWFKDQNALALGLDNWDWGSQESASGDIDAERKIRHTSSPAPAYGEGAHIMPGQPIGAINPSFFLHAQSYRGNYSTTGTTSESNNVLQPFNASPLQDGNDAQGPMYY